MLLLRRPQVCGEKLSRDFSFARRLFEAGPAAGTGRALRLRRPEVGPGRGGQSVPGLVREGGGADGFLPYACDGICEDGLTAGRVGHQPRSVTGTRSHRVIES